MSIPSFPAHGTRAFCGILVLIVVLLITPARSSPLSSDGDEMVVRMVRVLEADRGVLSDPHALVPNGAGKGFLVIERAATPDGERGTRIVRITPHGQLVEAETIEVDLADHPVLLDPRHGRLIGAGDLPRALVTMPMRRSGLPIPEDATFLDMNRLGLTRLRGMTLDPATGTLHLIDAAGPRLVRAVPDASGFFVQGSTIVLPPRLRAPDAVAFDPSIGTLHILDGAGQRLHEITPEGQVLASRDFSRLGLGAIRSMVFAPSRDETDDPQIHHLYVVHDPAAASTAPRGPSDEGIGEIVELSLQAPVVPQAAAFVSALIRTTRTSDWNPPSPDPAGVVYLPASGRLLVSDSEVNEMSIFQGVNAWQTTLAGTPIETFSTTSFSDEPTGVSVNPANGHLYISDDTGTRSIYTLDPGPDGRYGTPDDRVTSFPTGSFGSNDPEGVTYAVGLNVLFIADGVNTEIYRVSLSGTRLSNFDTAVHGLNDPEGIAYNPDTGTLYAVGKPENRVFEFTTAGALVRTLDISAANPDKPAGLAYGPRSNGPGRSLYIVARGVDNDSNPNENDGRMYEMTLPSTSTTNLPPVANDDSASTAAGTPVLIDVAANDVDPDGNLDRNSATTACAGCSVPTSGSLVNHGDGRFTYTPDSGFLGQDGFVYRICDTGGLCDTAGVTIIVSNAASFSRRVSAGSDDAEESASGSMSLTSSDLEMTFDGNTQKVGIRFTGLSIPQGARVTRAWIQFTVDETSADLTNLVIRGQNANHAATFTSTSGNISGRPVTSASVAWAPPPWDRVGDAGPAQRTPDLSPILEQIVARSGWVSGNAVAFIITGTGKRVAESLEGDAAAAPLLYVEYGTGTANRPPVAANDAWAVDEDGFLDVPAPGVIGNDSDPDGDPITASVMTGPAQGTLNLSANGSFTYAPRLDFHGTDTFTYRAGDGQAFSAPATVTLTVNPVNDPPVAVGDSYAMDANTQITVPAPGVLGNDSDPDGDPLTAVIVTGPTQGTLNLSANGAFTYTPPAGFQGTASFTYEARDAVLRSNTVTVTINVLRVNRAPVAVPDGYNGTEDTRLTVAATGVLGNDSDPDGDPIIAVLVSAPSGGTLNLSPTGSFTYDPAPNFFGRVTFTYRADDGRAVSNDATVTLDISGVNDPPSAAPDAYTTPAETRLSVAAPGVLGNDSDVEGSPLTALLVTGPANGVLALNPNGSFTYDPNPNFTGTDGFTYRSHDGAAASAAAAVTITVQVPPLSLSGIQPSTVTPGGSVGVTITGRSIRPGATVTFEGGSGPTPAAANIVVAADGRSLTANVSVKSGGAPRPRVWNVRVTNPGGETAVLQGAFTVVP